MCNFIEHIILGSWTADRSGAYIVLREHMQIGLMGGAAPDIYRTVGILSADTRLTKANKTGFGQLLRRYWQDLHVYLHRPIHFFFNDKNKL